MIRSISAGGGFSKNAVNGSVSVNVVSNEITAYILGSEVIMDSDILISAVDRTEIGAIAGAVSAAKENAVGVSVAVNTIGGSFFDSIQPHRVYAYIKDSKVVSEKGSIALEAVSNAIIKSISAAGSLSGKVAVNGSVSFNWINTDIAAFIEDCDSADGSKSVSAFGDIDIHAADHSAISAISGNISGSGKGSVGAAIAITLIGDGTIAGFDPFNNVVMDEQDWILDSEEEDMPEEAYAYPQPVYTGSGMVRAYIANSNVESLNGSIHLKATSNPVLFNIAAGAAAGGNAGVQGSVSINYINSQVAAKIINSKVTAHGDIILEALAQKRDSAPKGALQPESDDTPVHSFGEEEPVALTSVQAYAGAIGAGSKAGIGAVLAVNYITDHYEAGIVDSNVVSNNGNIILKALSNTGITTGSAALAGSGKLAFAGSASINLIQNEVRSFIHNSVVYSGNSDSTVINGNIRELP